MEEFTSSNLQLILGVKEGCHFDRVQKPTVIIATLNGQCLETKKVQPDCNPQYATDLTWETDKNAVRKMRCNQTPIKVECYAVNDNGSREKLGYILLGVRCAQIIHRGEEDKIKMNWHNILGVRNEFNNCKPKLMLYLIIKEKNVEAVDSVVKSNEFHETNMIHSDISPKWLQEERLIQLGPLDKCHDIFLLNITAVTLTNLKCILQEIQENEKNYFSFTYNILEMFFKLKPFKLESDNICLNQKIVIKIRTSPMILKNYLNTKTHFLIRLKTNNITVSQTEVNLNYLLTINYLQELKQIAKTVVSSKDYYCTLKNLHTRESKGDCIKAETEELPCLKIHIKLLRIEQNSIIGDKTDILLPDYSQLQLIKSDVPVSNYCNNLEEQEDNLNCINRVQRISSSEKLTYFNGNNVKSLIQNKATSTKSLDIYRSYCLNIKLNDIEFLDSSPDIKNIEFRFYYPHGDIITSICTDLVIEEKKVIKLQDVNCKLHFISTTEKIEELLSLFVPKISICDTTSNKKRCIAQTSLEIKKLFLQEKREFQYEAKLIDCHSQNEIGNLGITMILEDYTTSTTENVNKGNSGILFDNDVAYKIVDELETWKERQQEIFKGELQKKEEIHLKLLNEEWQRRRQYLEAKLTSSVQQCKMLANNLNKTIEDLKTRKIQSFEKETKLIQVNEELQWKYERKLSQLQEAVQKMQEDFSAKLKSLEDENRNLLLQIESLNSKTFELEKIKIEQSEKLDTYKKASLTEDQTTSVLQLLKNLEEKLDSAKKSKSFFKEQWSNAVKEIHRIKMENQKAIQSQIKSSKEELHNFNLEEILNADSAALTYDQIALDEIQREISSINPESNLQYKKFNSKEPLFTSQSDLCINSRNFLKSKTPANPGTNEKKLYALIEKRDDLLKRGAYSSDDAVIIKLNAEIRSLSMSDVN